MTNTTKATPRKWFIQRRISNGQIVITDGMQDMCRVQLDVFRVPWDEYRQGNQMDDPDNARSLARAALIVKAVNSFDEMLDKLKSLVDYLDYLEINELIVVDERGAENCPEELDNRVIAARAILAKLEEMEK